MVTQPDGSIVPGAGRVVGTDRSAHLRLQTAQGRQVAQRARVHGRRRQVQLRAPGLERQHQPVDLCPGPRQGRDARMRSTVRFTTKEPFAPFISYIAGPREGNIVPQEVVKEKGDLKATMIGTGPFKFVEYTPGNEARFVRNPDYWNKDEPLLDELIIKYIPDDTSRLAALRNSAVDFAYFGSAIFVKPIPERSGHSVGAGQGAEHAPLRAEQPGSAAQRRARSAGDQLVAQSPGDRRHQLARTGRGLDAHSARRRVLDAAQSAERAEVQARRRAGQETAGRRRAEQSEAADQDRPGCQLHGGLGADPVASSSAPGSSSRSSRRNRPPGSTISSRSTTTRC